MKDLSHRFLRPSEQQRIRDAAAAAEKNTSGEIVTMIVSASYHYPAARIKCAFALAFIFAVALSPVVGQWLWLGTHDMWVFVSLLAIGYALFYLLIDFFPGLLRLFVTRKEIKEEVEEAALKSFFTERLYKTRDQTGVLIFISVFEKMVWVLADKGINQRLPQKTWQGIVDGIIIGIKKKQPADAICRAIEEVGAILAEQFPIKPDDDDELRGLIIGD